MVSTLAAVGTFAFHICLIIQHEHLYCHTKTSLGVEILHILQWSNRTLKALTAGRRQVVPLFDEVLVRKSAH